MFQNEGGTSYGQLGMLKDGKVVPKVVDGEKKYQGANGGDVAFDATSTGDNGTFHNYAAPTAGAHGGVTSFNNNWPPVPILPDQAHGASAGNAVLHNYGAAGGREGCGGHTEFTALWGSPTGDHCTIHNYGSDISYSKESGFHGSCGGYTVFTVTTGVPSHVGDVDYPDESSRYKGPGTSGVKATGEYGIVEEDGKEYRYFPTAANATIYNYPAKSENGDPGSTKFAVYKPFSPHPSHEDPGGNVPTAGNSTIYNYGAEIKGAAGGLTAFSQAATAGHSTLIAYGGSNEGYSGQIEFANEAHGDNANIELHYGGTLALSYHYGSLTIQGLKIYESGTIKMQLEEKTTDLAITSDLYLDSDAVITFSFYAESAPESGNQYTVLSFDGLSQYTSLEQFKSYEVSGMTPTFQFKDDNTLVVTFE